MKQERMSRGEFIRGIVRVALLAALAAVCAISSRRRSRVSACDNAYACRGCPKSDGCLVRKTQGRGSQ